MAIKPSKTYLGYPTITLLGQTVDSLGLTTAAGKLSAIAGMSFPERLKDLERYLGFTGWLRDYIPYYTQKAEPLQIRKTMLLRDSPSKKGKARKNYSLRTIIIDPSDAELDAYSQLQEAFSNPSMLTHFSTTRRLYADVDTSKQGVGVMVYHLMTEYQYPHYLRKDKT